MKNRKALTLFLFCICIAWEGHSDEASDQASDQAKELKDRVSDLKLIEKNYGIRKDDMKEIDPSGECDGDYPREKVPHRAVRIRAKGSLSTSSVKFPKDSYITFCDGKLEYAATLGVLQLWGFSCRQMLTANGIKDEPTQETYYCSPAEDLKIQGVVVPKGVNVYFRHGKFLCFARHESSPDIKVGGVAIEMGKLYEVKNGKVVISKDCSKGFESKY